MPSVTQGFLFETISSVETGVRTLPWLELLSAWVRMSDKTIACFFCSASCDDTQSILLSSICLYPRDLYKQTQWGNRELIFYYLEDTVILIIDWDSKNIQYTHCLKDLNKEYPKQKSNKQTIKQTTLNQRELSNFSTFYALQNNKRSFYCLWN